MRISRTTLLPSLTYGYKIWTESEDLSRIKAAEITLLRMTVLLGRIKDFSNRKVYNEMMGMEGQLLRVNKETAEWMDTYRKWMKADSSRKCLGVKYRVYTNVLQEQDNDETHYVYQWKGCSVEELWKSTYAKIIRGNYNLKTGNSLV